MSAAVLRIALDMPLRRLFDYLPHEPGGSVTAEIGQRVRVPFGKQRLVGLVMEHADSSELPVTRLKPVLDVLDSEPVLDQAALELLRWAADYYHHPIGEVIAAAIPKALREGARALAVEQHWAITPEGADAWARSEPRRAPRQRELLGLLATTATALSEQRDGWQDAARALLKRGWIVSIERRVDPTLAPISGLSATHEESPSLRPELAPEQRDAVERVSESLGRFGSFVLYGITGSGKTEVYLQIVERVLARGQRALVLVPEIGLTPQLVERFRKRFTVPIAILHSALTDHERLHAWRAAFTGHARIVLGT